MDRFRPLHTYVGPWKSPVSWTGDDWRRFHMLFQWCRPYLKNMANDQKFGNGTECR